MADLSFPIPDFDEGEIERHRHDRKRARKRLGMAFHLYDRLCELEAIIHHWLEDDCNGAIRFNEDIGAYERWTLTRSGPDINLGFTPNLLSAALAEATALVERAGLRLYFQQDVRGESLYIYKPSDVKPGDVIDNIYSTVAFGISWPRR